MNRSQFEALLAARLAKTRATLSSKGKEYAPGADVLQNFKSAAEEFGGTPAEALWGYLKKHLISLRDMAAGPVTAALADEKVGDAICYLVLLEAAFAEQVPAREPAATKDQ